MNCFPCCPSQKNKKSLSKREHGSPPPPDPVTSRPPDMKKQKAEEGNNQVDNAEIKAKSFTFRELATATKNFRQECLIDEGDFGRVYRGTIPATGQAVAVKQLDRNGMQSSKEFLAEVATLTQLHHENLVNLIGYCADGDQRLLVYELFQGHPLEDRLFGNKAGEPLLNWYERMKIAAAASKGLEYLHESANPPVIFRDLRASNVLVDNDVQTKLCDFGMAKLSGGDKMNPRVTGTFGYSAPEYVRQGQFSAKSDVYSFGVILLELITGRRAVDTTRPNEEQNLVSWAQPLFRDPKRYPDMADPKLKNHFPAKDLNQAVAMVSMCLQEEAEARPLISDVVTALGFLSMVSPEPIPPSLSANSSVSRRSGASESESERGSEIGSTKGSSKKHVAPSAKYRDSEVVDIEDDYYKSDSQLKPVVSSKTSLRSSTRSRNGTLSSDSGDGSVSSSKKSHKSSKKSSSKDLSQKSSRKSSTSELSQKSSRKSSIKNLCQKSSRKSSTKVLSHKSSKVSDEGSVCSSHRSSSVTSDDGSAVSGRSSMRLSQGNMSFGLTSSGSVNSDRNSSRRTEEDSRHSSARRRSMRSDEGHSFD